MKNIGDADFKQEFDSPKGTFMIQTRPPLVNSLQFNSTSTLPSPPSGEKKGKKTSPASRSQHQNNGERERRKSGTLGLSIVSAAMRESSGPAPVGGSLGAVRSLRNKASSSTYVFPGVRMKKNRFASSSSSSSVVAPKFITPGITTGEEAAAYFARLHAEGEDTHGVFVYLRSVSSLQSSGESYNLVVVKLSAAGDDYYSMSSKGVVHITSKKHSTSEVIPLEQFMQHSALYRILRRSRLCRLWRASKVLWYWKADVRRKHYLQRRYSALNSLLLSKPVYCQSIIKVYGLLRHVEQIKFYQHGKPTSVPVYTVPEEDNILPSTNNSQFNQISTLEEWENYQYDMMQQGANYLEGLVIDIGTVVKQVHSKVIERKHHADVDEQERIKELKSKMGMPDKNKKMSIVALKNAEMEKLKELKAAIDEVNMMGTFVRLLDYMHVTTLLNASKMNNDDLLHHIQQLTSEQKFPIKITASFKTYASIPILHPDETNVTTSLNNVMKQFHGLFCSTSRLLVTSPCMDIVDEYCQELSQYGNKTAIGDRITPYQGPSIRTLLRRQTQSHTNDISYKIHNHICNSFDEARAFITIRLEPIQPVFDFKESFNPVQFRLQKHSLLSLKEFWFQLDDWQNKLSLIKAGYQFQWLFNECRTIKETFNPFVRNTKDYAKGVIVEVARDSSTNALSAYNVLVEELCDAPEMLVSYATFMSRLKQLESNGKQAAMNEAAKVQEMYKFINHLGIKVENEDLVQLDDMMHMQSMFTSALNRANEFVQGNLEEMVNALDNNLFDLTERVTNFSNELSGGIYNNPMSNSKEVLSAMKTTIKNQLDSFNKSAALYGEWKTMFIGSWETPNKLVKVREYYATRLNVWELMDQFTSLRDAWMTSPLVNVNAESLKETTEKLLVDAFVLDNRARGLVSAHVVGVIKEFKQLIPAILDLGNIHMKEHHWRSIFEEFQVSFPSNMQQFTLSNLIEWGIFDDKGFISDVAALASGEAALAQTLHDITTAWKQMEFAVIPSKAHPNAFILGGDKLQEIFDSLEDHQIALSTMLGSRYISGIKDTVENWEWKLRQLNDILEEWVLVQRSWIYLEPIFTAEDMISQMPDDAKKFQIVNSIWRKIMTTTAQDPKVLSVFNKKGAGLDEAEGSETLAILLQANSILESVQKSLEAYLKTKRYAFPRFYFLSNDELLDVLSKTKDPLAIQPHLMKCFSNVKKLKHQVNSSSNSSSLVNSSSEVYIRGMISAEGESVDFIRSIHAVGNIEKWLSAVEEAMIASLQHKTKEALSTLKDIHIDIDFINKFPACVSLLIDRIQWTGLVHNSLSLDNDSNIEANIIMSSLSLSDIHSIMKNKIVELVSLVRGELTLNQRTLIGALIVTEVNGRDIVNDLVEKDIQSIDSFEWQRQLRYYYTELNPPVTTTNIPEEQRFVTVRQSLASFEYGFEYLGNTPRLVITPLTDQCYLTLTGALHMRFGGSPSGPAGTGKTETVKDLAKALARLCIVFNCSDALDFKIMGRFFSGLAQAGAWACFDEFNRIEIEVLSVIAQQILSIQQAVLAGNKKFVFQDETLPLNANFGVFITMNPGYIGRVRLPDNLQALFRPVAMMVPNYKLIAEIILFSEGFEHATELANKMTQLYRLSSEQLSKQDHYDFGMRALKSVLVSAGRQKRLSCSANNNTEEELDEVVILIRAMRDSNIPKFTSQDAALFLGIVQDLFPHIDVPYINYGKLQIEVEKCIRALHLEILPSFVHKVIQLHETQLVRHGVMLVGEAGCGKSTLLSVLAKAIKKLLEAGVIDPVDDSYQQIDMHTLNPKAISLGGLFGSFNINTHEWRDGLIARFIRNASANDSKTRHWIVFDGPVDAGWIENMNTVLDDNKLLCLSNSERITVSKSVHLIFEVSDLVMASPATVSRCGMVYMDKTHVGVMSLIKSWMNKQSAALSGKRKGIECATILTALLEKHVPNILSFLRKKTREKIISSDVGLVTSLLNIIKSIFLHKEESLLVNSTNITNESHCDRGSSSNRSDEVSSSDEADSDSELDISVDCNFDLDDMNLSLHNLSVPTINLIKNLKLIQMNFVFCVVWALGGNLTLESRIEFDMFLREELQDYLHGLPSSWKLFDIVVDNKKEIYTSWQHQVPPFQFNSDCSFNEVIVPTQATVTYTHLLHLFRRHGFHSLLMANTGVGKSIIINEFFSQIKPNLSKLDNDEKSQQYYGDCSDSYSISFSAHSSTKQVIKHLEHNLECKRKCLLVPKNGYGQSIVHIDDMNMPQSDSYGVQSPIELLRQIIAGKNEDEFGYYDTKSLLFKKVRGVSIVGSCKPPGGSRNSLNSRILRHFNMLWIPLQSESSMKHIFEEIMGSFFDSKLPKYSIMVNDIVQASIEIYSHIQQTMLPTPSKMHYTFNLRDLGKTFQGMLLTPTDMVTNKSYMHRLWIHELSRVFRDRLVSKEDRSSFDKICVQTLRKVFQVKWNISDISDLLFGNFNSREPLQKRYQEFDDINEVEELFTKYNLHYNREFTNKMPLIFFKDAMDHVCRISRILNMPQGNALLVGISGTGRRSLTRLAAFVAGFKTFSIEISRNYGIKEWRDDLKSLLMSVGTTGNPIVFLLSASQVIDDECFEDINYILNAGDIPDLYNPDEMRDIIDAVTPIVKKLKIAPTRENVLSQYIKNIRSKLHCVLTFSPAGDSFRRRCLNFPALVSCCTIDWFDSWPVTALETLAMKRLDITKNTNDFSSDSTKQSSVYGYVPVASLASTCVFIHQKVGEVSLLLREQQMAKFCVTPTFYLELVDLYKSMIYSQTVSLQKKVSKYKNGLEQLDKTNYVVKSLRADLRIQEPLLVEASEATSQLLKRLDIDSTEAAAAKIQTTQDELQCSEEAKRIAIMKQECEMELAEAMPGYNKALKALKSLNKDHLFEVRSYISPPELVEKVMGAVCILFEKPPVWAEARKMLQQHKFLETLTNYDKDNIPNKVIEALKPYVLSGDFTPTKLTKVALAATSICMWVRAIYNYHIVFQEIKPKRERLNQSEESLRQSQENLKMVQIKLMKLTERVEALNYEVESSKLRKINLKREIAVNKSRLINAEKLVGGLGGETVRWKQIAKQLEEDNANIVGNVLISAAMIVYLGAIPSHLRQDLTHKWISKCYDFDIPVDQAFNLSRVISDPVTIQRWRTMELPADEFSTDNGIICTNARKWPLLIDPQEQGLRWLKRLEKDNNLLCVHPEGRHYLRDLENSIRYGIPVVLEDIGEELDAGLDPILLRQTFKRGGQKLLHFGESDVPYTKGFKLYLTTKLSNPKFLPVVAIITSVGAVLPSFSTDF